jgi:acetamidase/formamidase
MRVGSDHIHLAWDSAIPAVVEVDPGDQIELDLLDASGGQLTAASDATAVPRIDLAKVNPVTGPIRIRGAAAGDAVVVHVLELDVADWGWSALIPGFGLLAEDFPQPVLVHSQVSEGRVRLSFGPVLPAHPMIGTLGVALPQPGPHPLLPPSRYGGNMDIRHVTPGATLALPVGVDGALVSAGDAHATMGDGEVCGTGVETSARAVLRLELVPGRAPAAPVLETTPSSQRTGRALVTTGVGPDLMAAARDATRSSIDQVTRRTGLRPDEAYVLASLTADLVISEIVDAPNWVVSLHMPLAALE